MTARKRATKKARKLMKPWKGWCVLHGVTGWSKVFHRREEADEVPHCSDCRTIRVLVTEISPPKRKAKGGKREITGRKAKPN